MPICDCGRQTGNPEGVCVICEMDAKHPGLIDEVRGADSVANVAKEKICINCQKPYTPTSNSQKRCPECSRMVKRAKDRSYREVKRKQPEQKAMLKKISHDGNSGILQKLVEQRDKLNIAIAVIEEMR